MRLTFLGTGTSHGVPAIDCMMNNFEHCPQNVCRSADTDPKHARTRCSVLIENDGKFILIDTSLDFRHQMLVNKVRQIDAVLYTHAHSDHIGGLPDIRSYTRHKALPVYGSEPTIHSLIQRFDYIFNPPQIVGGGIPELQTHILQNIQKFSLLGMEIIPAEVTHGSLTGCFGYRIGNIGYIPDMKSMDDKSMSVFSGLDVLILNSLRRAPRHDTHLTLTESIELAGKLSPRRCYLTHMSHDIHYQHDQTALPPNITFAYDGLIIDV